MEERRRTRRRGRWRPARLPTRSLLAPALLTPTLLSTGAATAKADPSAASSASVVPATVPATAPLVTDRWVPPEHPSIVWRSDEWTKVKPWEDAMTIGLAVGSAIVDFTQSPTNPRWSGPILFDTAARSTFRLSSDVARSEAGSASDVLYYSNTFFPVVVDLGLVTLLARQSSEAGWQEFSLDAEAFAISGFVAGATQRFVARQRPFVAPCKVHPSNDDCDNSPAVENVSFISGHEAMAFTGAMLTCFHHHYLHLYNDKAADVGICATLLAAAVTTGFLRMMSDRHYASDVLAGTAVGLTVGTLVPAMHYNAFHPHVLGEHTFIVPTLSATEQGVSLVGSF